MSLPNKIKKTLFTILDVSFFVTLSGCATLASRMDSESERFDQFVTQYFDGKYGLARNELGNLGYLKSIADTIRAERAALALQRMRTIDTTRVTLDEKIDWLFLEASIKKTVRDLSLDAARKIPSRYVTIGNLYWQALGDERLEEKELKETVRVLKEIPILIALGRKQLYEPPPLWTKLAINSIARNEEFLSGTFLQYVSKRSPVRGRSELINATYRALIAFKRFRVFLSDTLKTGEEPSWIVGSDYYDWLLKEFHFLPFTAEEMIEEGWRVHRETKKEIEALANRINREKSVADLIEDMKSRHPAAGRIQEAYRKESDRAKALLLDKELITIPAPETLLFVPTPLAIRETYAWAGYGGINVREGVPHGRFFVTDVVEGMSENEITEKLRAQNYGWITVIALHEGYPGHHLQALYARENKSKVRSRLGSTYFGEGWALYCEAWMAREGFYQSADDSLAWLQMRLWRTARVIVDPSIHIGRMTFEEAVDFMVREVGLERSAAEAEVNRYTTWPTQAPSYIIGWLELERIKDFLVKRFGEQFDHRQFVEVVLKSGSLPLELMKRSVLDYYEISLSQKNN